MNVILRLFGHVLVSSLKIILFTWHELAQAIERTTNGTPVTFDNEAFKINASSAISPDLIIERNTVKKLREDNRALSDKLQSSIAESLDWQAQSLSQQGNVEKIFDLLERVKINYRKALEDSKVFDIDHQCKDFENKLKGRMFETRIALYFTKRAGFSLLNWTPDKGALSDIRVEANLHPDLLVEDKIKQSLFIECKFRGDGAIIDIEQLEMKQAISWAKTYQAARYEKFSKELGIPCWVAIGLEGDAASPNRIFLVPLLKLQTQSKTWKMKGEKSNQRVCEVSWLSQWEISLDSRYNYASFQQTTPLKENVYS